MIEWAVPRKEGLYIAPLDAYIDPSIPVARALITHGEVIATPQTLAIMALRYGADFTKKAVPLAYGERRQEGDVTISMASAGHVLGSAQIIIDYQSKRLVAAGDYKRKYDPTVTPFEIVPCDVFITEATFGLPVFAHPDPKDEVAKLRDILRLFPHRSCFIGAYALGKAQRVITLLRQSRFCLCQKNHVVALIKSWQVTLSWGRPQRLAARGQTVCLTL